LAYGGERQPAVGQRLIVWRRALRAGG